MRTIVITGASDGIGAAAAEQLAGISARVVVVGRSPEKTRAVAERLDVEHHIADFAELDQVRELAAVLKASCDRIDVLANNAGGMFSGPVRTTDGFERTFQINHLAPYLLTHLLIDRLISNKAAVVNTASIAAKMYAKPDLDDLNTWEGFTASKAYGNAKLANILFAKGLHERFAARGLTAVAFHPGVVATSFASQASNGFTRIYQGLAKVVLASPAKGGARLRHFIEGEPGVDWESGGFYGANLKPAKTYPAASDPAVIKEHWERSAAMLGIDW